MCGKRTVGKRAVWLLLVATRGEGGAIALFVGAALRLCIVPLRLAEDTAWR